MKRAISRRSCLKAAGVSLGLPFLEVMSAKAAVPSAPQRFVGMNMPLGFHADHFFPKQGGTGYEMSSYLKSAEPLRDKFTIISGTSHPGVDGGHSAEKCFLTAAPHPASRSFKNTISFDQFLAPRVGCETRYASLTTGDISLSWSANGVPIPTQSEPAKVFERLFVEGTPEEKARQRKHLADGKSILDVVLGDARSMQRVISQQDKEKLDQYFTAIRETEERLNRADSWSQTAKPEVEAEQPKQLESRDIVGRFRAHLDVIRLTLETDQTRVIAYGGNNGSQVLP
ncbi:MAG: DUF1552 domain-containing protein, partial [Verrucomicrobiota bacterium]